MQKRGQLTLFIILGIIVAVASLIYILVFSKYSIIDGVRAKSSNPEEFLEECIKKDMEALVINFLENNFHAEIPEDNFFRHNNNGVLEKIPILCTVGEFNVPCINQDPVLELRLKSDIRNEIDNLAESCWEKLISNLKRQSFTVEEDGSDTILYINKESIMVHIPSMISLVTSEETKVYSNFYIDFRTSIFKLASLANQIANHESTLCEFGETGWMLADNTVFITRFRAGDQTKLYTLKDRTTDEEIKFAIKTCVIPAGV
jgi:hypothetical protein